ncbi:MaoC-like dehydratase domain-containing protein [Heterostelium album PN500]|uniref:MaoC-like dehydratase domain-containing protein n=1 Tax=Heterostelium pallidum (strain ATCC 26659 / Pp 5 / PN500) TaxID=670386 RepID=D3BEY1_HETP5|nr:MaoC-like dehydratase domain-containing protein [Heterostelium album PN500]EFA80462.1 MaoC-like dehydratase domain-containing protein [Heterostelium album PN500]|eukprot:XP_020432582.1 MaoC-like dehydratase domain-containing protein [Heterostelium album PN500]
MDKQQLRRIKVISQHLREEDGVVASNTTAAKSLSELVVRAQTQRNQKNTRTLKGLDELKTYVSKDLGVTQYLKITQDRINDFAEATGDFQWIHVDPKRAADSPFGGTIAHGFLTLSLAPMFAEEVMPNIEGIQYFINCGFNKVRFLSPVPVDCNLRCRFTLQELVENASGANAVIKLTFEIEDNPKPAAICEWIVRFYKNQE